MDDPDYRNENLTESDTRSKLIDPALRRKGWTEQHIRREVTAGGIDIIDGKAKRQDNSKADYTMRLRVNSETQPVAIALIEAKRNQKPASHGLEQAKLYADTKRLNIPFVFSSNGYLWVMYDQNTGQITEPRPMSEFPSPDDLRARYAH